MKSMRFLNYVIDDGHECACLKSAFRKQYRWIEWTFTESQWLRVAWEGIAVMGAVKKEEPTFINCEPWTEMDLEDNGQMWWLVRLGPEPVWL